MGDSYLTTPVTFLVDTLIGLYILAVMLRFLLGTVRADFYNPVSQFLVRITNPVLLPLRRMLPSVGRLDSASLVLMLGLQMADLALIALLRGASLSLLTIFILAVAELVGLLLNVFLFAIFIQVILSWISPGTYNPVASILYSLTEPVLRPCRRLLPPIGGMDLSPLIALLGIQVLKMLLLPPLHHLAGG